MLTYKKHKSVDYEFIYGHIVYDIDKISPSLEQKRGHLIKSIQVKFKEIVLKYIDENYIKGKKDTVTILEVMLARFIMLQLSEEIGDPVIPSKVYTYTSLKNDLDVKLKKNKTLSKDDRKKIINSIIEELDLDKLFKNSLLKLKTYNTDTTNEQIIKKQNKKFITLKFKDDTIEIYHKLYNKIIKRYNKNYDGDVNVLIWCLIKRYIFLKSYNQQLAVHPQTMKQLKDNYKVNFELFGSVLNTTNSMYCSLFYDIEKYFGSFGSLFFFTPIEGSYTMNPPFDEFIIEKASEQMVNALDKTHKHLRIFIWIPIWDKDGIKYVNNNCLSNFKIDSSMYGTYKGFEILYKSDKLKCKKRICLQDITYFNYLQYIQKYVANTYLIIMDNIMEEDSCYEIFNNLILKQK